MEEVKQDVNAVEPSATEEQVVNEQVTDQPVAESTVVVDEQVPTNESVSPDPNLDLYDERGVPWKNVAMENQRKYDSMSVKLDEMSSTLNNLATTQTQPKYSIDELQMFANDPGTEDANRTWALSEIRKLEKEENASVIRNEINKWKQEQMDNQKRAHAQTEVQKLYPDAFTKDATGRITGWDTQSPLAQRIGYYMSNPSIQSSPEGLLAAAKMAYADMALQGTQVSKQKQEALTREVKNLQKQTMVEGGVNTPVATMTSKERAIQSSASGKEEDTAKALREIFKAKGVLKD